MTIGHRYSVGCNPVRGCSPAKYIRRTVSNEIVGKQTLKKRGVNCVQTPKGNDTDEMPIRKLCTVKSGTKEQLTKLFRFAYFNGLTIENEGKPVHSTSAGIRLPWTAVYSLFGHSSAFDLMNAKHWCIHQESTMNVAPPRGQGKEHKEYRGAYRVDTLIQPDCKPIPAKKDSR